MPRQPLLPTYKDAGIELGPGFLDSRPVLAAAITKCIALWSDIEFQHAMILAMLLRANTEPAVAVFLSLKNARSQRDVIIAAGNATLADQEQKLLIAIMAVGASLEKQRSDLAHGLYGKSDDIPDGILWIHTKDRAAQSLQLIKVYESGRIEAPDPQELKRKIFVYRISDLETLATELEAHHKTVYQFVGLAMRSPGESREAICQQLCREPPIRQALDRLDADLQSDPEAP